MSYLHGKDTHLRTVNGDRVVDLVLAFAIRQQRLALNPSMLFLVEVRIHNATFNVNRHIIQTRSSGLVTETFPRCYRK